VFGIGLALLTLGLTGFALVAVRVIFLLVLAYFERSRR